MERPPGSIIWTFADFQLIYILLTHVAGHTDRPGEECAAFTLVPLPPSLEVIVMSAGRPCDHVWVVEREPVVLEGFHEVQLRAPEVCRAGRVGAPSAPWRSAPPLSAFSAARSCFLGRRRCPTIPSLPRGKAGGTGASLRAFVSSPGAGKKPSPAVVLIVPLHAAGFCHLAGHGVRIVIMPEHRRGGTASAPAWRRNATTPPSVSNRGT
jgi:hypothetical protein